MSTQQDSAIRVRVCVAVVHEAKILLVPHYDTDAGPVQWVVPGGRVRFGESLRKAAVREFREETGLGTEIIGLLDVSEVILQDPRYHSITIAYLGRFSDGRLAAEPRHPYGEKKPRWFSAEEATSIAYHPSRAVRRALATRPVIAG